MKERHPMKQTIHDIAQWQGKRALVRVDFNVPQDDSGAITDDTRIRAALPTLQFLTAQGAKLVVMSHLGRPKGKVNPKYSLKPMVDRLAQLMAGTSVTLAPVTGDSILGPKVESLVAAQASGSIVVLENTRFELGDEANDPALSQALAKLGDVFVNDAFGACHRAHASTAGVANYVPLSVAGLLMAKEIEALSLVLKSPDQPKTALIGGSKISTKITVLENLLSKVQTIVIGGGMVYTFLKAQGLGIGTSIVENDHLETAKSLLDKAQAKGVQILLSQDLMVADKFEPTAATEVVSANAIPDGWMGMDIGPATCTQVQAVIAQSKVVLWNGPMGVFEMAPFAVGTRAVADALVTATANGCKTVLGGGDTVAAIEQFGIAPEKFTHVSTGGGASLEFIEGRELPGIAILAEKSPALV
jgi:phosphoglycerate kinase